MTTTGTPISGNSTQNVALNDGMRARNQVSPECRSSGTSSECQRNVRVEDGQQTDGCTVGRVEVSRLGRPPLLPRRRSLAEGAEHLVRSDRLQKLEPRSDEGGIDEEDEQERRRKDGPVGSSLAFGGALDERLGGKQL